MKFELIVFVIIATRRLHTLTLPNETYDRIIAAIHKAKKTDPRMYNSRFLDLLFDSYKKSRWEDSSGFW